MSDGDREELRLALALNGGVSLAVWMGGVTYEVNRLRTEAGEWGPALRVLSTEVRVDVISGASAGGINGSFLAAAMVYNTDLSPIRALWVNRGSFKDLLRSPIASSLPSLLKGDEYFLRELQGAFRALVGGQAATPDRVPIELTLTGTTLAGVETSRPDDFGSVITDVSHAAEFTFSRRPGMAAHEDPFQDEEIVAKLALAARCTASFPGAFEPSWVPVGESGGADHPDMAGHASFDRSGFVVDGGVLVNKPVGPALRTIYAQRSDTQVRRVLAYVVPDPGTEVSPTPTTRPPTPAPLRVVYDSLVTLPRVQSISSALDSYRMHNDDFRKRRGARDALVSKLEPDKVVSLATELFESYRAARRMSSCSYVVDEVAKGLNDLAPLGFVRWNRDELLQALYQAELPWLPQTRKDMHYRSRQPWRWGAFPIERAAGIVLDVVRRAYYLAPFDSRERARLGQLTGKVHDLLAELGARRDQGSRMWRNLVPAAELLDLLAASDPVRAVTDAVVASSLAALAEVSGDWAPCAERARRLLKAAGGILSDLGEAGGDGLVTAPSPLKVTEQTILGAWAAFATGDDDQIMARLLAFEVLETAFGQNDLRVNQAIEVVQVNAGAPGLIGPSRPAAARLAGVQLGHFGAFYKRSWRASDWMWGRLDGVSRLAQVLLDPRRLRQLAAGRPRFRDQIEEMLFGPDSPDNAWLRNAAGPGVDRELCALVGSGGAAPLDAVPACAAALVRRLQLEVLLEELPLVAAAVRADVAAGAARTGLGVEFADAWDRAVDSRRPGGLGPDQLIALLRECRIGDEVVDKDYGSDLFVATASAALATTVSVANDKNFGLSWGRHLISVLRAPVLVFWLLARNDRPGSSRSVLNALVLAVGATIVALSLFMAEGTPGLLVGFGWVLVGGGLLLAMSRSYLVVVGAATLAASAWGVWVVALHHPAPLASSTSEVPKVVTALLMLAVFVSLGSFRWPWRRRRPFKERS
jgi:patatin-related protein